MSSVEPDLNPAARPAGRSLLGSIGRMRSLSTFDEVAEKIPGVLYQQPCYCH